MDEDTYLPAFKLDTTRSHGHPDSLFIRKRRKSKPFGPAGLTVKHDGSVHDLSELAQKVLERFRRHASRKATDKDLGGTFVFSARDGALGVNLYCQ